MKYSLSKSTQVEGTHKISQFSMKCCPATPLLSIGSTRELASIPTDGGPAGPHGAA